MRRFILFILTILGLALFFVYAYYNGENYYTDIIALMPSLFYIISFFLLGLICFALRLNDYSFLFLFLTVLFLLFSSELSFNSKSQELNLDHPNKANLRIIQWNIRGWDLQLLEEFTEYLAALDADIYLLQEAVWKPNIISTEDYFNRIKEVFPLYYYAQNGEFLTISTFPIDTFKISKDRGHQYIVARTPYGTINIGNVHIIRPFMDSLIVEPYKNFFEFRENQFNSLFTRFSNIKNNNIFIAGDFNTMANHKYIKILSQYFVRNNPISLISFPLTYSIDLPAIRIDYVFTNKQNEFVNYQELTYKEGDVDHFGILSEVYVTTKY